MLAIASTQRSSARRDHAVSRKLASWQSTWRRKAKCRAGRKLDVKTWRVADYMHARYYNANVGRFTTVDPEVDEDVAIHLPQRWNRYSYGLSNPQKYLDRNGESITIAFPVAIITITGLVFIHEWEMASNPGYRKAWTD